MVGMEGRKSSLRDRVWVRGDMLWQGQLAQPRGPFKSHGGKHGHTVMWSQTEFAVAGAKHGFSVAEGNAGLIVANGVRDTRYISFMPR